MAVSTLDGMLAAIVNGERHVWSSPVGFASLQAIGAPLSYWRQASSPAGAAANPPTTPGENPTNATGGALPYTDPVSGLAYLAQFDGICNTTGTLILYDRLFHMSGLSGTVTTAQNVDPTPTNPVNRGPGVGGEAGAIGDDVEIWLEVYTALGATPQNVTASYTNSAGTAGRTVPSIASARVPASMAQGRMLPLPLQGGDTGVRSVQTVTLAGSTGTAGNFGVTLLRRIADIQIGAGMGDAADFAMLGQPRIYPGACLGVMFIPFVNAGNDLHVSYAIAKG